jgi:hypothetical protein
MKNFIYSIIKKFNDYINEKDYHEIILKNNKHIEVARALIDKEDIKKIIGYTFNLGTKGYVRTQLNGSPIKLHTLIMGKRDGLEIDYKNRNPLDNRKSNLRFVTTSQNAINTKLRITNTSGFKGISWDKTKNKWAVNLMKDGKKKYKQKFESLDEAVLMRQRAEIVYFIF